MIGTVIDDIASMKPGRASFIAITNVSGSGVS